MARPSSSDGSNEAYERALREAEVVDLTRVIKSGCVTIGQDPQGYPVIAFIPTIGFDFGEKSDETLHQIYLLFIKLAHPIVTSGPYSIVYSRKSTDWRKPLVYDYYLMLPEKEKKNLKKLYVISPQMGIRMFFTITRMFLSAEFYSKLVFIENIAEFQRIIPPKMIILPYNFLNSEDADRGLKSSGIAVPLSLDYDPTYCTTSIMQRCVRFLRNNGGLRKVGIFRVAGNENQLSLVRVRLQPPIYFTKTQMRAYMNSIIIGLEDTDYRANERTGTAQPRKKSGAVLNDDVSYNLSTVVITEIESVAQTLKLSLRTLAEPLITFKAFDVLMRITQIFDRKQCSKEKWQTEVGAIIKSMPVEHRNTLCYLLE
ncbi:unnamed protein product [Sphagnum jensenii]|uniref:Uncharacterized protein n=1 Tax=Sphagnum jensenii TaxID=128206 RepID=A0ABP0VEC7_9BRYO